MDVLDVVHCTNGIVSISLVGKAHETKATGATCVAVLDNNLHAMTVSRCCTLYAKELEPYSFLNGTKLLEFLTKSALISVPGKAAAAYQQVFAAQREEARTYPMNSLDMLVADLIPGLSLNIDIHTQNCSCAPSWKLHERMRGNKKSTSW